MSKQRHQEAIARLAEQMAPRSSGVAYAEVGAVRRMQKSARPVVVVREYAHPDFTDREVEVLRGWLMNDSKTACDEELYISGNGEYTPVAHSREVASRKVALRLQRSLS